MTTLDGVTACSGHLRTAPAAAATSYADGRCRVTAPVSSGVQGCTMPASAPAPRTWRPRSTELIHHDGRFAGFGDLAAANTLLGPQPCSPPV